MSGGWTNWMKSKLNPADSASVARGVTEAATWALLPPKVGPIVTFRGEISDDTIATIALNLVNDFGMTASATAAVKVFGRIIAPAYIEVTYVTAAGTTEEPRLTFNNDTVVVEPRVMEMVKGAGKIKEFKDMLSGLGATEFKDFPQAGGSKKSRRNRRLKRKTSTRRARR